MNILNMLVATAILVGGAERCQAIKWSCHCGTKSLGRVLHDGVKVVGATPGNVIRAGGDMIAVTGDAFHDTVKTGGDAASDYYATLTKAGKDSWDEGGRAVANVDELGVAVGKWMEAKVSDTANNVSASERRIREGKFADAFWQATYDQNLRNPEAQTAKLVHDSSLANTVGETAAAAYGGPGGTAAYAAWFTYRQTNDVQLALKVGLIAGATSAGLSKVSGIPVDPSNPAPDIAKKAIIAGTIGGVAVAVGGGDGAALRDGFLKAGGMVLIQDGYKQMLTPADGGKPQNLVKNAKSPSYPAFCTAAAPNVSKVCSPPLEWYRRNSAGKFVDLDGKVLPPGASPILDMGKVSNKYAYVGKANGTSAGNWITAETGGLMNGVAKIPGMNAMAIMHDQWVIYGLDGWTNQASIVPAIVVTYLGTESGIQDHLREVVQAANSERAKPVSSPETVSKNTQAEPSAAKAPSSYLCMKRLNGSQTLPRRILSFITPNWAESDDTVSRTIFVAEGRNEKQIACAVIYQKDDEQSTDTAPWSAVNDHNYCSPKAAELAQKHVQNGWDCLSRD